MNRVLLVVVGLMALTFLRAEGGGCDSSLVGDPTMDMWCGKTLCAWTVERGQIQRVATWHRSDYGVGLVGEEVILSQRAADTVGKGNCLELRLQADHDDGVSMFLELDLFGDDSAEVSLPFGSDGFAPSIVHVKMPLESRIRFVVRKVGKGAATLAEVKAKSVGDSNCYGVAPLTLTDLADGSPCSAGSQCRGGSCEDVKQWPGLSFDDPVCGSCTPGSACPGGQVCGLAWSGLADYIYPACVDKGQRALGERCLVKEECASGICCGSVCSTCCAASGDLCAVGSCAATPLHPLSTKTNLYTPPPSLCSPGGEVAGGLCLHDSDCASGSCKGSGPLKICSMDGRTCDKDKDCPTNSCVEVGQAGGLCQ